MLQNITFPEDKRIDSTTYESPNKESKQQNSKSALRYSTHHESSRKDGT